MGVPSCPFFVKTTLLCIISVINNHMQSHIIVSKHIKQLKIGAKNDKIYNS